jgi:putative transposase
VRLKTILQEVALEEDVHIEAIEIMPDHVHIVVNVDPQFGVHRLVKMMKGRSSRLLRQEFPSLRRRLPTLWTNSYFVATVGGAPLEVLKQYVVDQKNV